MYFLLTELTTCENPDILRIVLLGKSLFNIFSLLLPIILIILIIIDLIKMILSGNNNKGKSFKPIINRVVLSVAIFFVPTIVNLIMYNINRLGINSSENYSNCFVNANKESIEVYQTQLDAIEEEEEKRRKEVFKDFMEQNKDNYNDGQFSGTSGGSANSDSDEDGENDNNETNEQNDGSNNKPNGIESSGDLYISLANRMVQIAQNELGTSEGTNDENKYGADLGLNNQPWCAAFVTWVATYTKVNGTNLFNDVIQKESKIRNPFSAVNSIYTFQKNKNLNFYYSIFHGNRDYTPKKGDYIYFDWKGDWNGSINPNMFSEGDHVGIVEYVEGNKVHTIEGNTGSGNVARRNYDLNSNVIMGYGSWYK